MVKLKKLPIYLLALAVISPYMGRVIVENLLAMCGYAIVDGRLEKNLCE